MFEITISKDSNEQTDEMMYFNIQGEESIKAIVTAITDAMMKERRSTALGWKNKRSILSLG